MSRPRRVSRPLIAALAAVIVLGVFFTVHKLHASRAAEVRKTPAAAALREPDPPAIPASPAPPPAKTPAATSLTSVAKPTVASASSPSASTPSPDSGALVTQTPTEKAPVDSSSAASSDQMAPVKPVIADPATSAQGTPAPGTPALASPAQAAPQSHPPVVTPQVFSTQPLVDAKAKQDAGDLITARQILNDAFVSGKLSDADAASARKQIEQINQTLVFSARKFPDDPWGGTYSVLSGERLSTIAYKNSVSWELLSRVNGVSPKRLRSGQNIKIFKGPFHAVVYKRAFRMEIYLGNPGGPGSMYVTSFPVGLGKDNSTPTGLWMCKAGDKIRNPRYYPPRGGDVLAADDPKNPLAGYWIALEGLDGQALGKESYGIHGTIEPDSVGKMSSMGCIRLRADDISWVFDLLVDGKSKVVVKE